METESNTTCFTPAFHLYPELFRSFKTIENINLLQELLNASPHISMILNGNMQVLLSNIHLIKTTGLENLEMFSGGSPGKIIDCIHISPGHGCGGKESCRFCGIINTVKQSQTLHRRITNECRITAHKSGKLMFNEFEVTCTPVNINDGTFTLLNMADIGNIKRSEALENVFFHDILNRLGSLTGLIHVIKNENIQPEMFEYIDMLHAIGEMVIEDIQTQRFLKAAENANLMLNIRKHSAFEIIESMRQQICYHPAIKDAGIIIKSDCGDFNITTDGTLLKRIMLNMIKNAAEATPDKGTITITCAKKQNTALFSVNNPGKIPKEIQLQIFQRSFSTKGQGRGLGTYSMKLFGENYLKGKVYFKTGDKEGTTFTIELPYDNNGSI
jgi:nitrogen-specific signal transduction histidine kinase